MTRHIKTPFLHKLYKKSTILHKIYLYTEIYTNELKSLRNAKEAA